MDDKWLDRKMPTPSRRNFILWAFLSPPFALLIFFVIRADGAAEWVQAIGSVLAIAAGFAVVSVQERVRERKRQQESWIYMEKALHAASGAVASVDHVLHSLQSAPDMVDAQVLRGHVRLLQAAAQDLAVISFASIEDQSVASYWIGIKRCMLLASAALEDSLDEDNRIQLGGVYHWSREMNSMWKAMSSGIQNFVDRHDIDIAR